MSAPTERAADRTRDRAILVGFLQRHAAQKPRTMPSTARGRGPEPLCRQTPRGPF